MFYFFICKVADIILKIGLNYKYITFLIWTKDGGFGEGTDKEIDGYPQ
jgi:hypothetical protein